MYLRRHNVAADAGDDEDDDDDGSGGGGGGGGGDDGRGCCREASLPSTAGGNNSGFVIVVVAAAAQQQSSTNTDELIVVAVDAASSLQLLHDVRMDAIGAVTDDDDDFDGNRCEGFRNRSDAAGNSCSVCRGTSEKLSRLPLGDIQPGVGWITCEQRRVVFGFRSNATFVSATSKPALIKGFGRDDCYYNVYFFQEGSLFFCAPRVPNPLETTYETCPMKNVP